MMKNKWQWNHPELVAGRKGMGSIVPDYLRSYYAGWIAWCDGPDVKEQMTMDQAGPALLMLMDAHNIEYPSTWVDNDGPPKDWWTSFLKEFSNLTLVRLPPSPHSRALLTARSQGKANRLCEARVSASCPEAVNAWHDCVEKEIFEPEALASYLKKEMPHKLEEMGIAGDDDAILKEATEILHDPSRIGCFDQSGTPPLTPLVPRMVSLSAGFAVGGDAVKIFTATGGRRHSRDSADGTWITQSPLIFADGTLGFNAYIVRGNIHLDIAKTKEAFGDTLIATSKSGYSCGPLNLELWQKNYEKIKGRGIVIVFLDNWIGHYYLPFRQWCRKVGIILVSFRAHSTHYHCALDRYPLGVFARNYNIFIKAEKQQWRGRSTHAKLPFHLIAKVIAKANDLAFAPNSIITGFKTTLFRYIEDNETDSQAGDTLDDVDDENFFQVDNFENGVRIVLDRTIKKFAKDLAFDLGA